MIGEIARTAAESPAGRRILVTRNRGVGREVLRRLALESGGWIGFEHVTPASLAQDLVAAELARDGLSPVDELEQRAIVDEALDAALAESDGPLAALAEGVGLRDAVANAIEALRLAGVSPDELRAANLDDTPKQRVLAAVLESYERGLRNRARVDQAHVFGRAIARVEAHGLSARVLLLPDLRTRGLLGRFVETLKAAGAEVLPAESVRGLPAPAVLGAGEDSGAQPTRLGWLHAVPDAPPARPDDPALELFAAGSPADELREALRRALDSGCRWDEVEIVATDPVAYGCALDALATRLGIPVTYAVGLPIERTRQGRAARAYLDWLQTSFPSETVRLLLQGGDLRPAGDAPSGERLARRLRRLQIGWGRSRWVSRIERNLHGLEAEPEARPDDEHEAEEIEERRARAREELTALRSLMGAILDATPRVPDRLGRGAGPVSPAELAHGLLAFIAHVPARSPAESEAQARLTERLEQVAARLERKTGFGAALAILRAALEIRVPSPGTEGPLPWSSAGGALHFADLDHGGWTGRPLTFVVGLDAERFPGTGTQDPILLDADRARLAPGGALPTSIERLAERRWSLAALLARLRGHVTLSYAAWSATDGRAVAPAAEMLQAHRLVSGDPGADYEALRKALGPLACPVPGNATRLDTADVWLGALARDGLLLAGLPAVRAAWPDLDRGLQAAEARASAAFTPHDGAIRARPELDPRRNRDLVLSASTLQSLGTCPLRYLHAAVLGIRVPKDPRLEPDVWLDPLRRGSLLHAVYQTTLERARELDVGPNSDAFHDIAQAALAEQVALFREAVPAPSEIVVKHEIAKLETDVRSFVEMTREDVAHGAQWIDLEREFGYGAGGDPVDLPVAGGVIRTRGRIDRVDRLPDERLRVVDYKSGGTFQFKAGSGTYYGGRRLQHVLYARAAEVIYGAEVARMEYHFPTTKALNHRAVFTAAQYATGAEVLGRLLDLVAGGAFVPTNDKDDCRFCEHASICRVTYDKRGAVEASPRAAWSAGVIETLDVYGPFREVRRMEGAK